METDVASLLRRAAELAIDYRLRVAADISHCVSPPASLEAAFESPLPVTGTDPVAVIEELNRLAQPGLRPMTAPRFYGWVIGGSHPVGVAADWLTSAWGQNAGNHVAAPAAAAAEMVATRWLLELLELPRDCSLGFVTGATVANFVCLAAARGALLRRVGWDAEARGLFGAPEVHVLIGDDAHSTVFSALQFLGFGHDRVRRIQTDSQGRIVPEAFERAMAGCTGPTLAILQAGQINTGGFDPFGVLVPIARRRGAWVHVDGAFGLWARATPARTALTDGVEEADSWAVDGHKWLQAPYDSGFAVVRNAEAHARAMTIAASYLPPSGARERDPSHYVPELSRRARGFPAWAIIRHLGRNGIAEIVERHCRLASRMAESLARIPGISLLNDVVLNQVIIRFGDDDAASLGTIRRVQDKGTIFAGGAKWRGAWVMRLSVIGWDLDESDADQTVDAIAEAWDATKSQC